MEISIFRAVVPAILHIVLSAILIKNLIASKRNVATNQEEKRERKFTRIVVALNVFFCITELPLSIVTIYFGILGYTPSYPLPENLTYSLGLATIAYQTAIVLSGFTFNSLLFANLIFNKIFQREFGRIFCHKNYEDN